MSLWSQVRRPLLGAAVGFATGGWAGAAVGLASGLGGEAPGISNADRRALRMAQLQEEDRRKRLLEMQNRRSRMALGVEGGPRALLYGSIAGVNRTVGSSGQPTGLA